jgi:hypothetical protein
MNLSLIYPMWDLGFSQYTPSRPALFGLGA